MDGRFLTAFVLPKKWDVIGYELKPFSLRHQLVLTALESPITKGDVPGTKPEDILVFLRVCSSDNAFEALGKPTIRDRWRLALMGVNTGYFLSTMAAIHVYMQTCNTTPTVYRKEENKKTKNHEDVPGVLSMATSLMSRMHMSPTEAWDCTIGQAVWYLTAFSISEGADIRILTTKDEEDAEQQKKELKRLQQEALAKAKKEYANR